MTLEELLKLLEGASAEERAKVLAGLGITEDMIAKLGENDPAGGGGTGDDDAGAGGDDAGDTTPATVGASEAIRKTSGIGRILIDSAVTEANLDGSLREIVVAGLGDTFTEADLTRQIESVSNVAEKLGRKSLAPSVPDIRVTGEDRDKRLEKLDGFWDNAKESYKSLKVAYRDLMGADELGLDEIADDMIREAWAGNFDSGRGRTRRALESMTTASWGEILGDSITRRMVAEYGLDSLQSWRKIVSSIESLSDFRTQRITRMGGYGTLPAVAQGDPYTALTSPTDEEATYAATKRGGTEDITYEMIKNDDLRAIRLIPIRLGRAAAQTLYRFVWGFLPANAAIYDTVTLFHASHANTTATAPLNQANLSALRKKARKQTAYGDSSEVLGINTAPKFLVVPPDLEEIAFQLCTSAVAVPSTAAGPSDTPNIHQGMEPIVVDYYSDVDDWYTVADPKLCPTIEVGFLDGKEEPELFVNNDPSQGATFSNDKVTYKIRHIYGGAVLDYRGFQRATN